MSARRNNCQLEGNDLDTFPKEGNSSYRSMSNSFFKRPSFSERNLATNQETVLLSNCSPSSLTLLQHSSKATDLRVNDSPKLGIQGVSIFISQG